jgi:GDP-L-fucose synthase
MRPEARGSFNPAARVFVAGADSLLGAALLEQLRTGGFDHLVGGPPGAPDLTDAVQVADFFAESRPDYVFLTAGKSGGIDANQRYPAELMYHNLAVTTHVIHSAWRQRTRKLLYLASACCYPKLAPQPLGVESLMTGPLEPTNEAYATAKLAGLRLCQAYRQQYGVNFVAAIPTNSFGPGDDFSAASSHVIPGLIRRLHEAKLTGQGPSLIWGTGRARREFVYARDLAAACLLVMERYDQAEPINLGGGIDLSIAELAQAIADVVGYRGRLVFDPSRPDGMPFKGLEAGALRQLGWRPATPFRTALEETYAWFLSRVEVEDAEHVRAAV